MAFSLRLKRPLFALACMAQAAMGAESAYDYTVCTHSRHTPLEANAKPSAADTGQGRRRDWGKFNLP